MLKDCQGARERTSYRAREIESVLCGERGVRVAPRENEREVEGSFSSCEGWNSWTLAMKCLCLLILIPIHMIKCDELQYFTDIKTCVLLAVDSTSHDGQCWANKLWLCIAVGQCFELYDMENVLLHMTCQLMPDWCLFNSEVHLPICIETVVRKCLTDWRL